MRTKKDPTDIGCCEGMSWHKAGKWLRANAHMLALGKSREGLDVARSLSECGEEAGVAVLAAFLALRKNGLPPFVGEAVRMYGGAAKEMLADKGLPPGTRAKAEKLRNRLVDLEFGVLWMSRPKPGGFKWPLEMPAEMWKDLNKRCGLANVMMGISMRQLSESTTTEYLAMASIARFLKDGLGDKGHG